MIHQGMLALIALLAPAGTGDLVFRRHVVSAESEYSAVAVLDVNRDGRSDILCGGFWYEGPTWERHFVRDVERIGGRFDGYSHLPMDVNRDGWTDVITVNYRSRSIRWIEHPGERLGRWPMHTVAEPGPMETGRLFDVDNDGQLDVLPNGQPFAAWWSLDSTGTMPRWTRHELPREVAGHGMGFGDIDGDGRSDVVGPNGWAQAPPDRRQDRWSWHREFDLGRASVPVLVVDVDRDGDHDLVWARAHGFGIYWLEQQRAADHSRSWRQHTIDASWSQCHSPLWADLDGDGQPELIAGKRYMAHEGRDPGAYDPLVSYRYQFDTTSRTWRRRPISINEQVGFGLDPKIADLDADGDLDLVVCGRSGLYWLENTRPPSGKVPETPIPAYRDHDNLMVLSEAPGQERIVSTPFDWGQRRSHIIRAITRTLKSLPANRERVPLDTEVLHTEKRGELSRRQITFQVDSGRRISATMWLSPTAANASAVVCFQVGGTPDGAPDDDSLPSLVAQELAQRGMVVVVPELSIRDESAQPIWPCIRTIDLLESMPQVNEDRLACIGIGGGASWALLVGALDQRIVATVASGELSAASLPWPVDRISITEVLGAFAPRALSLRSANDVESFHRSVAAASTPYRFSSRARPPKIEGPSLSDDAAGRRVAYEQLEATLEGMRGGR